MDRQADLGFYNIRTGAATSRIVCLVLLSTAQEGHGVTRNGSEEHHD